MTGFESVSKCSEEASAKLDPRDFGRAMVLAVTIGAVFYASIILVVALVHKWGEVLTAPFGTAVTFEKAFQSRAVVHLIFAAALLSLFKVFNGNFLAATRLIFAMGRVKMLPSRLATVHSAYLTPSSAIIFGGVASLIAATLGDAVLVPISEVGSLAAAGGCSQPRSRFWPGRVSHPVNGELRPHRLSA